jgi:hypothetical protein
MTPDQYAVILNELGKIKGDLSFFEHHNLNTNYRKSEHHVKVEQSRKSIQKIKNLLKAINVPVSSEQSNSMDR